MKKWQINLSSKIYHLEGSFQNISYPESGNNDCFEIENNSDWFLQRNDLIKHFVKKYNPEGDFLDIGSGNGFQAKALIDSGYLHKVICCEPGIEGCLNSKKRNIEYVYNGFYEDFPFDEYNVKAIGLFDVIEHIEDDLAFLNNLYNKIQNGSLIFINVPGMKHLFSETDEFAGHFRRYNYGDINRILKNTNFKLVDSSYFFNFYYFPMLILRAFPYYFKLKKGKSKVREKENSYLSNQNKFITKLSNIFHTYSLKKLSQNKKINFGTSIFFVLKK